MELNHQKTSYPVFRGIAFTVAIGQLVIAIGFLVGGDFGTPAAFAMSWMLPAIALLLAVFATENRIHLIACVGCNLLGMTFLWVGYTFFAAWLYGNILTSNGADTLFVCCASVVNVVPAAICMFWYFKRAGTTAG